MPTWKSVPRSIRKRFPSPPERGAFDSQDEYEDALGFWQGSVGRAVGLALQKYKVETTTLYYRVVPHNGGVVFASPVRAKLIAAIHEAISTSDTWEQFRSRMPVDEFERLLASSFDDADERPEDSDHFSGSSIPDWEEGDYPHWLQQEMDRVLPRIVLDDYAEKMETSFNGHYWHIPAESCDEVCEVLKALGFVLEHRGDLPFH